MACFHKNGQNYLLHGHLLTALERKAHAFTGYGFTECVKKKAGNFL